MDSTRTSIDLSEQDISRINVIVEYLGCRSKGEAIRRAIYEMAEKIKEMGEKNE